MSDRDHDRDSQQAREGERFKVTDRRHFTVSGERRSEMAEEVEEVSHPSRGDTGAELGAGDRASSRFERKSIGEPEGVDFTMLVNAMAQPALLFLGEIPHPETGQPTIDLEQARIQIDMLGLLGVKCRGNLTAQEEKLLDRVLYQLRMLYVARTSKSG